jgi:ferredoxin
LGAAAAVEALEGATAAFTGNGYPAAEVDRELCRGCGGCADVCPEGAARLEESSRGVAAAHIASDLCSGCGNCLAKCPTGAVSLPEAQQGYYEKVMNAFLG